VPQKNGRVRLKLCSACAGRPAAFAGGDPFASPPTSLQIATARLKIMKMLLRLLPIILLGFVSVVRAAGLSAADRDKIIAAVTAADNERQAATIAADPARLDAILSDELRYAHSNGKVDTKTSYTESLVSHATIYQNFDYKERTFVAIAPNVALMNGRVIITVGNGTQNQAIDLNYLAVWREENGQWRFLRWQSCRNTAAAK
jgi:hypothetical protein